MVKKLMVASALTVTTTAMVLMAPSASRFAMAGDAAYPVAEDSVFMDEGDGEFSAPVAADVQQPAKKTSKKKAKVASAKTASPRKPASDGDDAPPAPGNLDDLDVNAMTEAAKAQNDQAAAPSAPAPTAEVAPAPAPQEAAAPAPEAPAPVADTAAPAVEAQAPAADEAPAKPKVKNHGSVKHASVEKADKVAPVAAHGMFASTKQACPMLREPASESEKMITVKADRKIWVEEVDGSWVRAFNKAGEPGYVSKDCFQ